MDPSKEKLIIKEPKWWEYLLYNNKMQILLVLILCAFIGIGTPFIWQEIWAIKSDSCSIESDLRYNCYPQRPSLEKNKTECLLAQCCWDEYARDDQIKCYYAIIKDKDEKMPGYKIETSDGDISAILQVNRIPKYLDKNQTNLINGPDVVQILLLNVTHYTPEHFSIRIGKQNSKDYSEYLTTYEKLNANNSVVSDATISFPKKTNEDFTLSVKRKQTNTRLFNTGQYSPFIFSEGYIEITTLLPNDLIFGLGQSPSKSFKHNMTFPQEWAIFNKHNLNLTANQTSWFGSHPFYMGLEGDGNAYGVLLINTHPIQIITNSRPSLTFRTIGGDLHFHFFMGPTPKDVIKQLTSLIRKPSLPPYWALGFHLCRTTCDLNDAHSVLKDMRSNSVPVESDCGSSAYSTILSNPKVLELKGFHSKHDEIYKTVVQVPQKVDFDVEEIRSGKRNDVMIPGYAIDTFNRWKDDALTYSNDTMYRGFFYDWCGGSSGKLIKNSSVIFPSYLSDEVEKSLTQELDFYFDDIDGLLLDYNTPLDLSYSRKGNKTCPSSLNQNKWDLYHYSELNENTPCLDLIHKDKDKSTHMSLHNLYGYQHMKMAKNALSNHKSSKKQPNQRKLVMSLSTFIGSGYLGGHIGIGMNSSWDMLKQTLIQTLEFNMYGIPLTGFPVCGFKGWAKDEELCLRWYQLAALQPFMISHRDFKQNLTDPISLANGDIKALEALKSAITIRYQLLPYLYTQFYRANRFGEMAMRPLFVEYPDDSKTYRLDKQFLWGSALMVSPVTELGVKSVKAYFPEGNWYDFYSGRRIASKKGGHLDLSAVEYHINLHIRGGHVIPTQPAGSNTKESRKNPFILIAGLDSNKSATGELFMDDGITERNTYESKDYLLINFVITSHNITIERVDNDAKLNINTTIDTIKIFGITDPPHPLKFKTTIQINKNSNTTTIRDLPASDGKMSYDSTWGVLTLKRLNLDMSSSISFLEWNYKEWNK